MAEDAIYYFGCWDRVGHYLHVPGGATVRESWIPEDFPLNWKTLDGGLLPKHQDPVSRYLWRTTGWTIVTMWDRTVDSRPNSCAAFVVRGEMGMQEVWNLARQHFPVQVERLTKQAAKGAW